MTYKKELPNRDIWSELFVVRYRRHWFKSHIHQAVQCSLSSMGYGNRGYIRNLSLIQQHHIQCVTSTNWILKEWQHMAGFDDDGVWMKSIPHYDMNPSCQQGIVQSDGDSMLVLCVFMGQNFGPLIRLKM